MAIKVIREYYIKKKPKLSGNFYKELEIAWELFKI